MTWWEGTLYATSAIAWWFAIRYWRMIRRHKREAVELIREARRNTDLADLDHWSDICRLCHHDRADHRPSRCHKVIGWDHTLCPPEYRMCACNRFEPSR